MNFRTAATAAAAEAPAADLTAESSSGKPSLKRAAHRLLQQSAKRRKQELDNEDAGLRAPTHYTLPWASKQPFSNLSHMCQAPMAKTVLQSLKRKGTNLRFLCNTVCGAAVEEGSRYFQTRALARICKEAKFHKRIARDLPLVSQISLPVQSRKKLKQQKFSPMAAIFSCALDLET